MKRIRVAPGKFVMVSSELAEKAARIRMLTAEEARALVEMAPKIAAGPMLGKPSMRRRKPKRR